MSPRIPRSLLPVALLLLVDAAPAAAKEGWTPPEPVPAGETGAPAPRRGAPPEQPQGEQRPLRFAIRMNMDFGGERIAKFSFSDGSTAEIKAGQLFTFAGGVIYVSPTAPWALEATVGYKFDKVNGSNGSATFSRIPIDVIASLSSERHRLGAGVTAHLSPTFECKLTGVCAGKVELDTAIGAIAQYSFSIPFPKANGGIELAARYTYVKYKKSGSPDLDGSAPGFMLGFWF
jgi:hypothetical protein